MSMRRDVITLAGSLVATAAVALVYADWLHVSNALIVGLTFLLVVLTAAANARSWVAATISILATLALNFFFLPPVGTLYLADPQNWVALVAFLAVGLVASHLSTTARLRAQEALARHVQLIEEREAAELARRSEALTSALLASLSHDLRTPLTAIRVAASNLQALTLDATDRREQGEVILVEVARLQRLFQNILEMARIDAGAVSAAPRWTHPSEIIAAARDQAAVALRGRVVDVQADSDVAVQLDPRLPAAALAQVLENAAHYSPPGSPIAVIADIGADGLTISVRDRGAGIAPADLPHLFDRFYRGAAATGRAVGTGMGLSIARGLLAAGHGRIQVENCQDGGARFTLVVPGAQKAAVPPESAS